MLKIFLFIIIILMMIDKSIATAPPIEAVVMLDGSSYENDLVFNTGIYTNVGAVQVANVQSGFGNAIHIGVLTSRRYALENTTRNFKIKNNNFTIEGWFMMNRTSLNQDFSIFRFSERPSGVGSTENKRIELTLIVSGGASSVRPRLVETRVGEVVFINPIALGNKSYLNSTTKWHHFALQFSNYSGFHNVSLYIDGVFNGSAKRNVSDLGINTTIIGLVDGTDFWQGGLDEFRLSNISRYNWGVRRFTLPIAPYTRDVNTMALYHFDDLVLPSSYKFNIVLASVSSGDAQRFYANITDNSRRLSCLYFQVNDTNTRTGIPENVSLCSIINKANSSTNKGYNFETGNDNAFQLMKIFFNDSSSNWNTTINKKNFTITQAVISGGSGGVGRGGGIRTSNLITELELSCGTRIFSFLYYTKPNKFSRDTICKNDGKSNLNAELEITEKLSKYIKAEFCDIDGLKCSNNINLFSGESGLLKIKADIPRDFKFEDGFINIKSGSKVNQFGVEIAPNIGYGIIGFISGLTGISDIVTIWILFVFVLIAMVLLFYYGGI